MNEKTDGQSSAKTERLGCGEFTQYLTADDYNAIKMALEAIASHFDKVRCGDLKKLTVLEVDIPPKDE